MAPLACTLPLLAPRYNDTITGTTSDQLLHGCLNHHEVQSALQGLKSHALQWIPLPIDITNTEDLGKWLTSDGQGMAVDLGGKTMQPKGGYEKEAYGLTWTEHPHPHWHMSFLTGNTRVRNGTIVLIDRLALTIEGPSVTLENITFEGMVAVISDFLLATQWHGLTIGQPKHSGNTGGRH